ncbi:hypothetical protein [Helicobacter sp. NHP22-001]|nr:hypothetical protein [Helicobacter sp. NHP22-001]
METLLELPQAHAKTLENKGTLHKVTKPIEGFKLWFIRFGVCVD